MIGGQRRAFGVTLYGLDDRGLVARKRLDWDGIEGVLYRARVLTKDPSLGGWFVDIAGAEPLFVKETRSTRHWQEGSLVVVQGSREPDDDKSGRATAEIRLRGSGLDLTPMAGQPEVEAHLPKDQRRQLLTRLRALAGDQGLVAKAEAASIDDDRLLRTAEELQNFWANLRGAAESAMRPGAVTGFDQRVSSTLADMTGRFGFRLVCDRSDRLAFSKWCERDPLTAAIAVDQTDEPLADALGITDDLADLEKSSISLPGGGLLHVRATRACFTADVDSAGARDRSAVNAEAIRALARQVALADIGGLILVDFLPLTNRAQRDALEKAVLQALAVFAPDARLRRLDQDGVALLERPRPAQGSWSRDQMSCPLCDGTGERPSPRRALEDLIDRLAEQPRQEPRIALPAPLYAWATGRGRNLVDRALASYGLTIRFERQSEQPGEPS
ncbi:MAG: ribonuclease E/G [Geminicoccaceae bacterium]